MSRIVPLVTILLFLTSCHFLESKELTEEASAYKRNFEIIGEEKEAIIGQVHPKIFEPALKEKKNLEENILYIDHKTDRPYQLSTGRYEISGIGTGYVYLYDEQDELIFREYIAYGIEKVQVDIKDSYKFRFNGLEEVVLTEIEPKVTKELTPGVWEVGTHIEAGSYEVSGVGFGYMQVFSSIEDSRLYELVELSMNQSKVEVTFEDQQKVIISGSPQVILDPL